MTFDAQETSRFGGAPVYFFKFQTGGTVIGRYTSADHARSIADPDDEHLYTPLQISCTLPRFNAEDAAANITVSLPASHEVAQRFIPYLPPRPVLLTVYQLHRTDEDLQLITIWDGDVISPFFAGPECRLQCAPASNAFKRKVPTLVVQRRCAWVVGSPGCTIDIPGDFTDTATLSAVDPVALTITSTTFGTHPDGYYKSGRVEGSDGEMRVVRGHVGDTLTIFGPMPSSFAVAAEVSASAGCDGSWATCTERFDNLLNNSGCEVMPGRNPFNGQSLI